MVLVDETSRNTRLTPIAQIVRVYKSNNNVLRHVLLSSFINDDTLF